MRDVWPAPEEGFVENPTDADYARAAREAMRRKNAPLAIEQVTAALAMRPAHEPHLRLLDEILAKFGRPLLLLKLPAEGAFFGTCAARGHALAKLGRFDEAVDALFAATVFSPETPFLPWIERWLDEPKACRVIAIGTVVRGVTSLTNPPAAGPGAEANLTAALALTERLSDQHPGDEDLATARSRLLRALDRVGEALEVLESSGELETWGGLVELAAVHGRLGDPRSRRRALERAAALRPGEASTYVDLGDDDLDQGDLERARDHYQRATELDPTRWWPRVASAYASAVVDGRDMVDLQGVPAELAARTELLASDAQIVHSRLPDPLDPLVAVIRSVAASMPDDDGRLVVRVRADRPRAPSAALAFSALMARRGREGELVVQHEPNSEKFGPLWTAMGDRALGEPSPEWRKAVSQLAQQPYRWSHWCGRAESVAAAAEVSMLDDIRATMVWPEACPAPVDAVHWIHAQQVAATLLLASAPVPATLRLEALVGLLEATDDWVGAAAALGLARLAEREPEVEAVVVEALRASVPSDDEPLHCACRAIAVAGGRVAEGDDRVIFFRLRGRARVELEGVGR